MADSVLVQTIRRGVDAIPLVDTHEHLRPEKERLAQRLDLFYLFPHYASSDLVSAGMPVSDLLAVRDPSRPLEERWSKFARYWERMKNTGYGRALLIAARDLFQVATIDRDSYELLSERLQASNRLGWYLHVLRDLANIESSIVDVETTEVDRTLFHPAVRFDNFIMARSRVDIRELEKATGVAIHSLDDHMRALDVAFERAVSGGMVAVKSALAYRRTLAFCKVTRHEAETVFNRIFSHWDELREVAWPAAGFGLSWEETKPFQDYMMHQVIRRAIDAQLPIQIHTGLQEGNSNLITNSRPTLLVNLLIEYPEAKFDLFHAGYPYSGELAALAKNFPNVYADMCWMYIISPSASRRVLHEWIETVPGNKILAFGGDYRIVEGAYAHARMARDGVAQVLTEKVQEDYLTENEALDLARRLLHDNAYELFNLSSFSSSAADDAS